MWWRFLAFLRPWMPCKKLLRWTKRTVLLTLFNLSAYIQSWDVLSANLFNLSTYIQRWGVLSVNLFNFSAYIQRWDVLSVNLLNLSAYIQRWDVSQKITKDILLSKVKKEKYFKKTCSCLYQFLLIFFLFYFFVKQLCNLLHVGGIHDDGETLSKIKNSKVN